MKYSSMKTTPIAGNHYLIDDMIEKPAPGQEFSLFSILGRCLLTPEIYPLLENTKPGAGGEIQLTDAMERLLAEEEMYALVVDPSEGCDTGTPAAWAATNARMALEDPAFADAFREEFGEKGVQLLG